MHYFLCIIIKYKVIIAKSSLLNTIYNNIPYDYQSKNLYCSNLVLRFLIFATPLTKTFLKNFYILCLLYILSFVQVSIILLYIKNTKKKFLRKTYKVNINSLSCL